MSWNLLLWKWSDDFDTGAKRKRAGLKFADVTGGFADDEDHPAIGPADVEPLIEALVAEFGDEVLGPDGPFILERYDHCLVLNYPDRVRFEIVPRIHEVARRLGFNTGEF